MDPGRRPSALCLVPKVPLPFAHWPGAGHRADSAAGSTGPQQPPNLRYKRHCWVLGGLSGAGGQSEPPHSESGPWRRGWGGEGGAPCHSWPGPPLHEPPRGGPRRPPPAGPERWGQGRGLGGCCRQGRLLGRGEQTGAADRAPFHPLRGAGRAQPPACRPPGGNPPGQKHESPMA